MEERARDFARQACVPIIAKLAKDGCFNGDDINLVTKALLDFHAQESRELIFLLKLGKQIDDFECDHDAEHRCNCGNVHTQMILKYDKERDEALAKYQKALKPHSWREG